MCNLEILVKILITLCGLTPAVGKLLFIVVSLCFSYLSIEEESLNSSLGF